MIQVGTKKELVNLMSVTVREKGYNCNLNFIDTSLITNMSQLFFCIPAFNGDISRWNTSKVEDMSYMFQGSRFNGDISKWDLSSVRNMDCMFSYSCFNNYIGEWDVSSVTTMRGMFCNSYFNQDIGNWKLNKNVILDDIFYNSKFSIGYLYKWRNYKIKDLDKYINKEFLKSKFIEIS